LRVRIRRFSDVFFDFGGTLFSYAALAGQAFDLVTRAAARLGIEAPPAELGGALARASRESWAAFAGQPYYLHRDLFQEAFRRWARALGVEPDQDSLDWMHAHQRGALLERFSLREGCLETLRELRARGLRLSIVSNIDDDYLHPMLARAGLDLVLHHWSSSEEARSCKPDPGFFRYACRKAGCAPEQVLFVGDSPEHDVAGARALGMTTVLIPEVGAEPPGKGTSQAGEPHHVIERLPDLLALDGLAT
jgi:putative hydrolase of the HAD superfamily